MERPSRRAIFRASLALLVLASAAAALTAAPPASAAPAIPGCTAAIENPTATANISAVLGQIVKFSGDITVTTGTSNPRTLAIEATIDPPEWGAQVTPTSENISDGEVVHFNATVAVPPAALASITAQLTIDASFQAVPGVAESRRECSAEATLRVEAYYRVDIDTTRPRFSINQGPAGTEVTLLVNNLGNSKDSFTLSAEDPQYLSDSRIQTSLPLRIIDLAPGVETAFSFTLNATGKPGTYDLAVELRSDHSTEARDSIVYIVTVNETVIDQLLPSDITSVAILGGVVAALVGFVAVRRRGRRKKAARDLQALLRQRRASEQEATAAEDWPEGGAVPDGASASPPPEPGAPPASQERVRVTVKAPPRA